MGWFWAEPQPKPSQLVAPHPVPKDGAVPPPSCPMHKAGANSPFAPKASAATTEAPSQITPPTSSCPVKSPSQTAQYQDTSAPTKSSWSATLNPLNYMPNFQNEKPTGSPQTINLPLERETSTIPRGDKPGQTWEYPSPQQMYNAMLRKGYTDTPAEDVESMVAVHNFLNEGAWAEIVDWENIFAKGLSNAWETCRHGEEGIAAARAKREYLAELREQRRQAAGLRQSTDSDLQPTLLRFQGRPNEPTPKARTLSLLSKMFPNSFGSEPPFDRHDWFVARAQPNGTVKEVRYVIDYYGGGLQATGEPVFYLDIRPALDSPTAAAERLMRWGGDFWWRATGSGIRDEMKRDRINQNEA